MSSTARLRHSLLQPINSLGWGPGTLLTSPAPPEPALSPPAAPAFLKRLTPAPPTAPHLVPTPGTFARAAPIAQQRLPVLTLSYISEVPFPAARSKLGSPHPHLFSAPASLSRPSSLIHSLRVYMMSAYCPSDMVGPSAPGHSYLAPNLNHMVTEAAQFQYAGYEIGGNSVTPISHSAFISCLLPGGPNPSLPWASSWRRLPSVLSCSECVTSQGVCIQKGTRRRGLRRIQ